MITCAEQNGQKLNQDYTQSQKELAREVSQYLNDNLEKHITINQLAKTFHVSQTQLKLVFRRIYGTSIYSYARGKKMEKAAQILENSSCTVLEVASRCGYSNGSKFAQAFRDEIGLSPREYRASLKNNSDK